MDRKFDLKKVEMSYKTYSSSGVTPRMHIILRIDRFAVQPAYRPCKPGPP